MDRRRLIKRISEATPGGTAVMDVFLGRILAIFKSTEEERNRATYEFDETQMEVSTVHSRAQGGSQVGGGCYKVVVACLRRV